MAVTFCRTTKKNLSARYELGHYGVYLAGVLARTWCRKMTWIMNGHDAASFEFPSEFADNLAQIQAKRMGPRRVKELMEL